MFLFFRCDTGQGRACPKRVGCTPKPRRPSACRRHPRFAAAPPPVLGALLTWKHSLSPRPQRERSPCQLLLCGPPGGPRGKRRGRQVRRDSSASALSVSPPTRSGRLGPCPSHPRGRRLRRQDRARGGGRCPSRFGLPRAPHPHARPLRPQGGARYTPQSLEPRRGPLSLPPSQAPEPAAGSPWGHSPAALLGPRCPTPASGLVIGRVWPRGPPAAVPAT